MKKIVATIIATTTLAFTASSAFAEPSCSVPKEKWMKEADFRTMAEGQGYKIKTFKVTKNDCYEIYGFDKDGKKVEIYFNPETGAELERK